MKKIISIFLIIITLVSLSSGALAISFSPPFSVESQGIYLYNVTHDQVIYEKNANEKMFPASLTKIMTVLLALENIENRDATYLAKPLYIQDMLYGKNASHADIHLNEEVSVTSLLYACMLPSANEAALMLADYMGNGSLPDFCAMMNQKAKDIGCTNTNFANPNGLHDENNYTTPKDMGLIVEYAMNVPGFMDICKETSYDLGPTSLRESLVVTSTISMMVPSSSYYYEPITGIKTGTLSQSGRCFASSATLNGETYLMVLLGGPLTDEAGNAVMSNFIETKAIYEWAFSSFEEKKLVSSGQYIAELGVDLCSKIDSMGLITDSSFSSFLPSSLDTSTLKLVPSFPERLEAPIAEGELIGTLSVQLEGEEIGQLGLVAATSAEKSPWLSFLSATKEFLSSTGFRLFLGILLLLIVLLVFLKINGNRRKRRYGRRKSSLRR